VSGNRGEMMKLVKKLRKQGFDVQRTGSGHWMVKSPDGKGSTVLSFSPGSRGIVKTMKQLEKIGYKP
jgi:predicted RNA binding protein YcfA (HicA-like mRNA interferase family)